MSLNNPTPFEKRIVARDNAIITSNIGKNGFKSYSSSCQSIRHRQPIILTDSEKKKIDEIYAKLKAGEKWEDLVKLYSDDPSSNQKGGELPMFGSGTNQRMVPVFEEAAFGLKSDGEISEPVQTDFGFHIIKRLEWKPVRPFNEMKKEKFRMNQEGEQ